jgi:hypothetical protein
VHALGNIAGDSVELRDIVLRGNVLPELLRHIILFFACHEGPHCDNVVQLVLVCLLGAGSKIGARARARTQCAQKMHTCSRWSCAACSHAHSAAGSRIDLHR